MQLQSIISRPAIMQRLMSPGGGLFVFSGMLSGIILVCAVTPLRLLLGTNHEVDAAMVITAALCCWLTCTFTPAMAGRQQWVRWILPSAVAWTLLLPRLLSLLLNMTSAIPLHNYESSAMAYGTIFGMTAICLLPVFSAMRISYLRSVSKGTSGSWKWLFGLGVACLCLPTLVLPFVGTTVLAWSGLALSCGWSILAIFIPEQAPLDEDGLALSRSRMTEPVLAGSLSDSTSVPAPFDWIASLGALATGAALALVAFIAGQLIPRNLTLDMALLAGIVVGMGMSVVRHGWHRTAAGSGISTSAVCLFLAAWTGAITAGYPLWTSFCLHMNAWVENVGMLFALRMSLLMLLVLPAGFLVLRLTSPSQHAGRSPLIPGLIAIGFVAAPWVPCAPHVLAAGLVLAASCLTLLAWSRENFRLPTHLWQRLGTAGLACLTLGGIFFSGNLDPQNSERVLFSGAALQSLRQGITEKQLNWIDESRQLADFTSLADRLSLWRQHGSQLLLRQNGMTLGLYSTNAGICPHNAGDLLPSLLPLALHPNPEHVLVMGIHPPTLLTCHAWPLRGVQCVDGSAQAHQMLHWLTSHPESGIDLRRGPDFRFHHVDPVRSLYSRHTLQYDLITCPITHPSIAGSTSQITREFYQQVRLHLNDGGIFSQRLPYYDLGPDVVLEVIATLQQVFDDVRAVESVPGELIFLCSVHKLPELDEAFVERLKAPQTRSLLAHAGWDWSLILGRGGLDHAGLAKVCEAMHRRNTCSNSRLTYWLPMEISRWGRKGDATRLTLAKQGDALRASLEESAPGKEVSERLEDLNLAHQIQRDHPNDPWAYRAALKSRLQDRPRATIMQVNHQLKRVMDPEDQRRKDYLTELGPSARNPRPSASAIQALAAFEAPFDPLVSLFVYFETANMWSRCEPPQPTLQLQHLLHTVYFSSGYDQSVRNVSDALELLCNHPEIDISQTARWDEMNSLMQMLAQRWQLRLSKHQVSKYEAADTERCLAVIDATMKELERHHQMAGLSQTDWDYRKLTLEQALIRPLRQHRSEQARDVPLVPVVVKSKDPQTPQGAAKH